MTDAMTHHSDAELLAAFVDGRLERAELDAVTAHLASCEECRGVIGEAGAFQREQEKARTGRRTLFAVAAAVAIAILGLPIAWKDWHRRQVRNEVRALHAAQAAKQRVIEARFSGQDLYAPHTVFRGGTEESTDAKIDEKIDGAAAKLWLTTEHDTSSAGLRAHAQAQVIRQDLDGALQTLDRIPEPRDAAAWNDLAVVLLARHEYNLAIDAVNKALKLQPNMPEALFNRALILRQMRSPEAPNALKDYLAVDPHSPWAVEAQKNTPSQ